MLWWKYRQMEGTDVTPTKERSDLGRPLNLPDAKLFSFVCLCFMFVFVCFVFCVFCVLCLCFVSMFCVYVLCGIVKRWDLLPLNLSPDTKLFPLTANLINSRPEQSILLFGLSVQHGKKRFICAAPQQDTRFSVQLGVYHPPDSKWGCITSNPC